MRECGNPHFYYAGKKEVIIAPANHSIDPTVVPKSGAPAMLAAVRKAIRDEPNPGEGLEQSSLVFGETYMKSYTRGSSKLNSVLARIDYTVRGIC